MNGREDEGRVKRWESFRRRRESRIDGRREGKRVNGRVVEGRVK